MGGGATDLQRPLNYKSNFQLLNRSYYRNSKVIIVVYEILSENT
jgi:hypothetical protein